MRGLGGLGFVRHEDFGKAIKRGVWAARREPCRHCREEKKKEGERDWWLRFGGFGREIGVTQGERSSTGPSPSIQ